MSLGIPYNVVNKGSAAVNEYFEACNSLNELKLTLNEKSSLYRQLIKYAVTRYRTGQNTEVNSNYEMLNEEQYFMWARSKPTQVLKKLKESVEAMQEAEEVALQMAEIESKMTKLKQRKEELDKS
ncbi:hypothetical protein ACI2JA_03725 [Alkalihalobacillus sp. NPDC078783]